MCDLALQWHWRVNRFLTRTYSPERIVSRSKLHLWLVCKQTLRTFFDENLHLSRGNPPRPLDLQVLPKAVWDDQTLTQAHIAAAKSDILALSMPENVASESLDVAIAPSSIMLTSTVDRLSSLPPELHEYVIDLVAKQSVPLFAEAVSQDTDLEDNLLPTSAIESQQLMGGSALDSGPNLEVRATPYLPHLASTCRQAYHEVAAAYYRENTFVIRLYSDVESFREWLECPSRTPAHRKALLANFRAVRLRFYSHNRIFIIAVDMRKGGEMDARYHFDRPHWCTCELRELLKEAETAILPEEGAGQNRLISYVLRVEAIVSHPGLGRTVKRGWFCRTCIERQTAPVRGPGAGA